MFWYGEENLYIAVVSKLASASCTYLRKSTVILLRFELDVKLCGMREHSGQTALSSFM